jgi:hypothetical protein
MDRLGILDDVKKEFFRVPIRVQGGSSSEADWREVEARAAIIVERISEPSATLKACSFLWSIVRTCISYFLRIRRNLCIYLRERRSAVAPGVH